MFSTLIIRSAEAQSDCYKVQFEAAKQEGKNDDIVGILAHATLTGILSTHYSVKEHFSKRKRPIMEESVARYRQEETSEKTTMEAKKRPLSPLLPVFEPTLTGENDETTTPSQNPKVEEVHTPIDSMMLGSTCGGLYRRLERKQQSMPLKLRSKKMEKTTSMMSLWSLCQQSFLKSQQCVAFLEALPS